MKYYPETSFFEYVLLQSRDRYGVAPPSVPARAASSAGSNETDLYWLFSGGLAVQQSLQPETLSAGPQIGDLDTHISRLAPPSLRSLDYKELLAAKENKGLAPAVPEIAKLVPADHYFLLFKSMQTANELMDLAEQWGDSLLQIFAMTARRSHLQEKYEDQLCVRRDALTQLFADKVITEMALTGSDFFVREGTDVTLVFRLDKPQCTSTADDRRPIVVRPVHQPPRRNRGLAPLRGRRANRDGRNPTRRVTATCNGGRGGGYRF